MARFKLDNVFYYGDCEVEKYIYSIVEVTTKEDRAAGDHAHHTLVWFPRYRENLNIYHAVHLLKESIDIESGFVPSDIFYSVWPESSICGRDLERLDIRVDDESFNSWSEQYEPKIKRKSYNQLPHGPNFNYVSGLDVSVFPDFDESQKENRG